MSTWLIVILVVIGIINLVIASVGAKDMIRHGIDPGDEEDCHDLFMLFVVITIGVPVLFINFIRFVYEGGFEDGVITHTLPKEPPQDRYMV